MDAGDVFIVQSVNIFCVTIRYNSSGAAEYRCKKISRPIASKDSVRIYSVVCHLFLASRDVGGSYLSFQVFSINVMKRIQALLIAIVVICFGSSAHGKESIFNELRYGVSWVQPNWLDSGHIENNQFGVNIAIFFHPVDIHFWGEKKGSQSNVLKSFFNPRPIVGGLLNLDDNGTDYVNAGLSWHFDISKSYFVEFGFGGAWNNGLRRETATREEIGSRWLFNESAALGYNATEKVTLVVQWEHLSHGGLAGSMNRGLTNLSARIGIRF